MADRPVEEWEETPDFPPPEPAPADWVMPTPVETQIEAGPGIQVEDKAAEKREREATKRRRFWTTTGVFAALYVLSLFTVDTGGNPLVMLVPLIPAYLLTLPFVLRTPRKKGQPSLVDRVDWLSRLMSGVVVFLILYLPFTFFSDKVLPLSSLVEYVIFALLLFILLRIAGRSVGVAPASDALPPPTHRLHRQVVAPIDDVHYQRTLFLNYTFVERGRGSKDLAQRLDQLMVDNGVHDERRAEVLSPLRSYHEARGFFARRTQALDEQQRRGQMLESLFADLNRTLEQPQ